MVRWSSASMKKSLQPATLSGHRAGRFLEPLLGIGTESHLEGAVAVAHRAVVADDGNAGRKMIEQLGEFHVGTVMARSCWSLARMKMVVN